MPTYSPCPSTSILPPTFLVASVNAKLEVTWLHIVGLNSSLSFWRCSACIVFPRSDWKWHPLTESNKSLTKQVINQVLKTKLHVCLPNSLSCLRTLHPWRHPNLNPYLGGVCTYTMPYTAINHPCFGLWEQVTASFCFGLVLLLSTELEYSLKSTTKNYFISSS